MKLVAAIAILLSSCFAFATETYESCLTDYALNAVEEFNLPNESLVATTEAAKEMTLEVLRRGGSEMKAEKAGKFLKNSQAVGVILQYGDEVQLIYVALNIKDDQCLVREVGGLNTVDMTGEATGLTATDAAKFFLGNTKQDLDNKFGQDSSAGQVYSELEKTLANEY